MIYFFPNGYRLIFGHDIQYKCFNEKDYQGITFTIDNRKIEVIYNYVLGYRILISGPNGECRDIPFNENTFHFLPEGVVAEKGKEIKLEKI